MRRKGHLHALIWTFVAIAALVLYILTIDPVVHGLGLGEEAAERWTGSWGALWPIVLLLGCSPVLFLDRALAIHPVVLPIGAVKRAVTVGLTSALTLVLIFPVNYLAAVHSWESDVAYFRTARAGDSTRSLVRTLGEPVAVTMFYPPGSEVKEELLTYFKPLVDLGEGMLTVKVVDQPVVPELAKELKVRENGSIVVQKGEVKETIKIADEMKKARRDLKKLDQTVQKNLLKITREERVIYMMVGHGEASAREKANLLRKTNLFKKILQTQNYKVKDYGLAEGSASAAPDDAALIVLAAPEEQLDSGEVDTLIRYLKDGGSLMILVEHDSNPIATDEMSLPEDASESDNESGDPGADKKLSFEDLLTELGVAVGEHPLAHAEQFIPLQRRGKSERVMLVTNRFGSHDSVKTLSRNSTQLALAMFTSVNVEKLDDAKGKLTTIIRTFPDTWIDANGNREQDEDEKGKVWDMGVVIEGPDEAKYRAAVIGDVNLISDPIIQFSRGNQQFVLDSVRWLVGDDEVSGEVTSEEDVKIQHTREEDVLYFYLTIFGVPALVLAFGGMVIRLRRRKA
ncbi:MAG: hypothetical protein HN348_22470 [Proteobacteria bacterium]|nr:hypothetical protein [Pseudomonadota bacterium]